MSSAGGLVYTANFQGAVMPATGSELWELAPPISCRLLELRIAINQQANLNLVPNFGFFALTIARLTAGGSGGGISVAPLDQRNTVAPVTLILSSPSTPGTAGQIITAANFDNGSSQFVWPGDAPTDRAILITPATRVGIFLVPIYASASFTLSSTITFEEF